MSYALPTARYVPHSEATRAHYERLLFDIQRTLPPGVTDDIADVAEEVLAVVCGGGNNNNSSSATTAAAGTTSADVQAKQQRLERLLDTRLTREMRDHFLHYGRLFTDYVANDSSHDGDDGGGAGAQQALQATEAVRTLATAADDDDVADRAHRIGRSDDSGDSSSSSDEDTREADELALLTGMARSRRGHRGGSGGVAASSSSSSLAAARRDKSLAQFAFDGNNNDDEEDNLAAADADSAGHVMASAAEAGASAATRRREAGGNVVAAVDVDDDGDEEADDAAAVAGDDGDGGAAAAAAAAISFNSVACNADYVKDTLRRLLPAQSVEACAAQAVRVLEFLADECVDCLTLETQLTAFLGGYDDDAVASWVGAAAASRWAIVYGSRYARCASQAERQHVMQAMRAHAARGEAAVARLYESLTGTEAISTAQATAMQLLRAGQPSAEGRQQRRRRRRRDGEDEDDELDDVDEDEQQQQQEQQQRVASATTLSSAAPLRKIDLLACAFRDERAPHQHMRATVPSGTRRIVYETHDEVVLPPSSSSSSSSSSAAAEATTATTSPDGQTTSDAETRVRIDAFPAWAQPAFAGVTELNAMQSRVFACAFASDDNMLVCAPTGAGKTNVAVMTMLRAVGHALRATYKHNNNNSDNDNSSSSSLDAAATRRRLRHVKMVYVAPMRALVQEMVRTFRTRLAPLGLRVVELTGDARTSQRQLAEAHVIVTTPEKWDVVTRKSVELGVAAALRLLILDEVHLLHNARGPVLEALVARTLLQQEERQLQRALRRGGGADATSSGGDDARDVDDAIRIVALSATLPNYADVASFLRVDRQRGLYVFGAAYRPVPLQQTYCAVRRVQGVSAAAVLNRVVYDKVLQTVLASEQAMVFVHSRRETEHTARYLQQRFAEEHRQHSVVRPGSESARVLHELLVRAEDEGGGGAGASLPRRALLQLLTHGFAIHHAGLTREERHLVEGLFAARHVRVLVCTSTLAWGVNLPANHVIIKGTRVYSGASGSAELLSALDVLQMFGRAGRVGFGATLGHATIVTSPDDLHYYLAVLNMQLPIESHLLRRVVDMLNAEVVLGHVRSVDDGVRWLQRTYYAVRLRCAPERYGTRARADDPLMQRYMANVVHTALDLLRATRMVDYDATSRRVSATTYGRIAAHCYVTQPSMAVYLTQLRSSMHDSDLFSVFAQSSEFASLTVRAEEAAQLRELLASAPVAVREPRDSGVAKANVLLQCYISGKSLEGLPLMSELVYIKDSALRILRAMYDICLVREYGATARQVLELYVMTLRRQWATQSPTRQVAGPSVAVAAAASNSSSSSDGSSSSGSSTAAVVSDKRFAAMLPSLERLRVPWPQLRRLQADELAERLGDDERRGATAYECIRHVPHYRVDAAVRPLTRQLLYVDVDVTPDFAYAAALHGEHTVCELEVLMELPGGRLLHHETVRLPLRCVQTRRTHSLPVMVVPMISPRPTHLYVRVVSSYWLGAAATAAVCLLGTLLPPIAPALRELTEDTTHNNSNNDDEEGGGPRSVTAMLAPYGLSAVGERIFAFDTFTQLQSELVQPLLQHDHLLPNNNNNSSSSSSSATQAPSVFAGVPPGAGKTVLAELFVLQFLLERAAHTAREDANASNGGSAAAASSSPPSRSRGHVLLYVTAHDDVALRRYLDWSYKFGEVLHEPVLRLDDEDDDGCDGCDDDGAGNVRDDGFGAASIVVCTATALLPRVRRGAAELRRVTHIIADHLHLLRAPNGRHMDECLARLHSAPYLVCGGVRRARLLALAYPLVRCGELCRWLRVPSSRQYNFGLSHRTLRVRMVSVDVPGAAARYEAGVLAALALLQPLSLSSSSASAASVYSSASCVLFVPHAREVVRMATRVLHRCGRAAIAAGAAAADDDDDDDDDDEDDDEQQRQQHRSRHRHRHQHSSGSDTHYADVEDRRLRVLLRAGVAFIDRSTTAMDVVTVLEQLEQPARDPHTQAALPLRLVCSFDAAWRLPAAAFATALLCTAERPRHGDEGSIVTRAAAGDEEEEDEEATVDEDDEADMAADEYSDCAVAELLQMCSRAALEAVVYCRPARRWVLSRLLNDALPLESSLRYPEEMCDAINAAIAARAMMTTTTTSPSSSSPLSSSRYCTRADVLRVLQTHYLLYHLRTHLHYYDVPSEEDVPLFASEFVARVVALLRRLRCVRVIGTRRGKAARPSHAAEGEDDNKEEHDEDESEDENEDDDEDEDDAAARVVPTARGVALARCCVAVTTARNITVALSTPRTTSRQDDDVVAAAGGGGALRPLTRSERAALRRGSVAALWRLCARCCVELSSSAASPQLSDATRLRDAAQRRALHTLARALPPRYGVRYVDLDTHDDRNSSSSKGSDSTTKVYVLVLAYVARLLLVPRGGAYATHEQPPPQQQHPCSGAAVDAATVALLCRHIAPATAASLEDDVLQLLPTVRRVLRALVHVLDAREHAQEARGVMHLVQMLRRRVWAGDDALAQLPLLQQAQAQQHADVHAYNNKNNNNNDKDAIVSLPRALSTADALVAAVPQLSLAQLQSAPATVLPAVRTALTAAYAHEQLNLMSSDVYGDKDDTDSAEACVAAAAAERCAAVLLRQATRVPYLRRLVAVGSVVPAAAAAAAPAAVASAKSSNEDEHDDTRLGNRDAAAVAMALYDTADSGTHKHSSSGGGDEDVAHTLLVRVAVTAEVLWSPSSSTSVAAVAAADNTDAHDKCTGDTTASAAASSEEGDGEALWWWVACYARTRSTSASASEASHDGASTAAAATRDDAHTDEATDESKDVATVAAADAAATTTRAPPARPSLQRLALTMCRMTPCASVAATEHVNNTTTTQTAATDASPAAAAHTVTASCASSCSSSSLYTIRGSLYIPVATLEQADMDAVEVVAAVTSCAYRIDVETAVQFVADDGADEV